MRARSIKPVRREIILIACVFAYSVMALLLTRHIHAGFYGTRDSMFANIYSGYPAYAHLNWALLAERWHVIFTERLYLLWLGFVVSIEMGNSRAQPVHRRGLRWLPAVVSAQLDGGE